MIKQYYLKVCSKTLTSQDGSNFVAYFGYHKEFNGKDFVDTSKDPSSIKVVFNGDKASALKARNFPVMVKLDNSCYFITIDKDPETKAPRRDKNGKSHYVLVLKDYLEVMECAPVSITLDDLA